MNYNQTNKYCPQCALPYAFQPDTLERICTCGVSGKTTEILPPHTEINTIELYDAYNKLQTLKEYIDKEIQNIQYEILTPAEHDAIKNTDKLLGSIEALEKLKKIYETD